MGYDDTTRELPEVEIKSEVLKPAPCEYLCLGCRKTCGEISGLPKGHRHPEHLEGYLLCGWQRLRKP